MGDFNGDGVVDYDDALIFLDAWGFCDSPTGAPQNIRDCFENNQTDLGALNICIDNL